MLYHYSEISFCNALHGDLFRHLFNLLQSLHFLCIIDHKYIKKFLKGAVHLNYEQLIVCMCYIFAYFVLEFIL